MAKLVRRLSVQLRTGFLPCVFESYYSIVILACVGSGLAKEDSRNLQLLRWTCGPRIYVARLMP
jgi:hypothetical protein